MTAEIAIMNKGAIALAADSAVTIGDQKIYNTVNKLFMLSKYHPIGLMVYGNSELMTVPWETIIKIYRKGIGKNSFDTLEEYADNFMSYIDNNTALFSDSMQLLYFNSNILSFFVVVREGIDKEIKAVLAKDKEIGEDLIREIVSNNIKKHYEIWEKYSKLPNIPDGHDEAIINKYKNEIKQAKEKIFEKLPISDSSFIQLEKICGHLFIKDRFHHNISGIAIAGFGDREVFPVLAHFIVDGVANNKMKYKKVKVSKIDLNSSTARIIPLAQRETVDTFIQGIDPQYLKEISAYFSELFNKYPEYVIKGIDQLTDDKKKELEDKLKKVGINLINEFNNIMGLYRRQNYIDPIIDAVAVLPKDELAAMAEALVNLTSFKRRISIGKETVGGPIDVAVISKGDGFVWIKRKHYFKPELNPHFFANYYCGDNPIKEKKDGKEDDGGE